MKIDSQKIEHLTLLAVIEVLRNEGCDVQQLIDRVRVHVMAPPAKSRVAGLSPFYKPAIVERMEVLVDQLANA